MLTDPELAPAFERSYVIVHLDVLENAGKEELETPGGEAVLERLGGKGAGLPYFAVLAPNGKKLGDSLRVPGDVRSNTGHPAATEEVAHFLALLGKTAPRMDAAARAKVEAYAKRAGR